MSTALVVAGLALLALSGLGVWHKFARPKRMPLSRAQASAPEAWSATEVDADTDERLLGERGDGSQEEGYYFVLDTETIRPIEETAEGGVRLSPAVSLAWQVLSREGHCLEEVHHLLLREDELSEEATSLHGITTEAMRSGGLSPREVYSQMLSALEPCSVIVAHNLAFHLSVVRLDLDASASFAPIAELIDAKEGICLMMEGTRLGFKRRRDGEPMYPRLDELFAFLHGIPRIKVRYRTKGLRDVRLASACLRHLFLPS